MAVESTWEVEIAGIRPDGSAYRRSVQFHIEGGDVAIKNIVDLLMDSLVEDDGIFNTNTTGDIISTEFYDYE